MKRLALIALGSMTTLAACGSFGAAPDGSGSGRIVSVKTEYATQLATATQPGQYVGCDRITNPSDVTRATKTQVVVDFAAAGDIDSVRVELRGDRTNEYDRFFVTDVPAGQLKKRSDGTYAVIFDANSATGQFLPNSIVVNPTELPIKRVTVNEADRVAGGFYADLTIRTKTSVFTLTSRNLGLTPVYRQCTLASTAQPLSQ